MKISNVSRALLCTSSIAGLVAAMAAFVWTPLGDPRPGEFSDSVDYLFFADYFRAWHRGEITPLLSSFFATTRFPPLFPLLLSVAGAGPREPLMAYWVTSVTAMLAVLLAAIWLVRECRSTLAGLALAAVWALNPGLQLLVLNPMSEPLFVCLCLWVFLWSKDVVEGRRALLPLAAVVGLVPLCRMAGLALVAATIAWLLLHRIGDWRRRCLAIAIAVLPSLAWLAYRRSMPVAFGYVESLTLPQLLEVFGGWQNWLTGQPLRALESYVTSMSPWPITHLLPITLLITPLAAWGLILRLRKLELDAFFLVVYGGLVLCWPFPAEMDRLLLVTFPIWLLCVWQGLHSLLLRILSLRADTAILSSWAVVLGWAVLSGPFFVEAFSRATTSVEAELEPYKRRIDFFRAKESNVAFGGLEGIVRLEFARDATARRVPKSECVHAFEDAALRLRDVQVRLLSYAPGDSPLKEKLRACRYLFITGATSEQTKMPPLYPLDEVRDWMRPVFISSMKFEGRDVTLAILLQADDRPR